MPPCRRPMLRRLTLRQPYSASPIILPDELIVEILSFLPVKSLMKFRCVNKFFKSIIFDPHFVQMHLKKSSQNLHVAQFWRRNRKVRDASLVTLSIPYLLQKKITFLHHSPVCDQLIDYLNEGRVVGSCNGLICFLCYSFDHRSDQLCIWNPATRTKSTRFTIPFRYSFNCSFGYDNSTGTYKVVAFSAQMVHKKSVVKVFKLGDNSWRDIQYFPVLPLYCSGRDKNKGVYLSGTINWLALRNYNYNDYDKYDWFKGVTVEQYVIVSLDLSTESYNQMLLPRDFVEVPPRDVQPTLVLLTNCLCFGHDLKRSHFVLWQMKDFAVQESWVQLFKISYQTLGKRVCVYLFQPSEFLPLYLSKNGHTVIFARYETGPAFVYNCKDNKIEQIRRTSNNIWSPWVNNYIESLVPNP